MATKTGVPDFTPGIPESPILNNDLVSREYFLHLCNLFYFINTSDK